MNTEIILQHITMPNEICQEKCQHLFFKDSRIGDNPCKHPFAKVHPNDPKEIRERKERVKRYNLENSVKFNVNKNCVDVACSQAVNFSTYFQMFSAAKWYKYTELESLKLKVELSGKGKIIVYRFDFPAFKSISETNKFKQVIHAFKSNYWIRHRCKKCKVKTVDFNYEKKSTIEIDLDGIRDTLIGFEIVAAKRTEIYGGAFIGTVDDSKIKNVDLAIAMTTFNNEEYVLPNIEMIKQEINNPKSELASHLDLFVIDNGNTLNIDEIQSDNVHVFYNPNVGGSGGFCRGMIEVMRASKDFSHLIIMDDDVTVFIESFFRTYRFLSILKPEHKDSFLAGAMLKDNEMDVQHENLGFVQKNGWFAPKNGGLILDNYTACAANDTEWPDYGYQYAGWWYCCIPMTCVTESSLPLPLFIRGDDVEYSLRNQSEILTLNGVCVWHGSFDLKYSAQMELYQVLRNSLIIQACHEHMSEIEFIKNCMVLFDRQCVEFQYDYANLILDAIEDFMQGPFIIEKPNGIQKIKEKSKFNEELQPIEDFGFSEDEISSEEIIHRINYFRYRILRKINTWSYNGQLHLKFLVGNKTDKIFHDWGFLAENVFMRKQLIAIDVYNKKAALRKRDQEAFNRVYARKNKLMKEYELNKNHIIRAYRDAFPRLTSIKFWKKYLGIE